MTWVEWRQKTKKTIGTLPASERPYTNLGKPTRFAPIPNPAPLLA